MTYVIRKWKVWIAAFTVVGLVVAAIVGAWVIAVNTANSSNHKWCTTLELLTSHQVHKPADPKANPSREGAYQFYVNLKKLERQFNC